jgi:hypothetical protein
VFVTRHSNLADAHVVFHLVADHAATSAGIMTNKYKSSKREIDEYTLTINHYLNNSLSKNNLNFNTKRCSVESGLGALGQLECSMSLCEPSVSEQLSLDISGANENNSSTQKENKSLISNPYFLSLLLSLPVSHSSRGVRGQAQDG